MPAHNLTDYPVGFRKPDPAIVEHDDAVVTHPGLFAALNVAPDEPDAIREQIWREGAIATRNAVVDVIENST